MATYLDSLASSVARGDVTFNDLRTMLGRPTVAVDESNWMASPEKIRERLTQMYTNAGRGADLYTPMGGATNGGQGGNAGESRNAYEAMLTAFPWIKDIVSGSVIQGWLADGYSGEAIVGLIRQQPAWLERFAGIRREDGSLRMTEAEFMRTEDAYEQALRRFGIDTSSYAGRSRFKAFFEIETDPNELVERLEKYDQLKRMGRDTIDAFYVYGGLRIGVDDLYRATVDPSYAAQLSQQYEQAATKSPLDYQTFITRATEAGLERVAQSLQDLRAQGVDVGDAASRIRSLAPAFATQMTDLLAGGGNAAGGRSSLLSLNELLNAFEYAMIGSAASANGLVLPEKERLEQFRQAGVERTRALEAYGQYASQRNLLSGMVQRAQLGPRFTQADFEDAVFLRTADATQLLEQAQLREAALAKTQGAAAVRQDAAGRFAQPGLRSGLN